MTEELGKMLPKKTIGRLKMEARVLKACHGKDYKSLSELAAVLRVNANTLRAHYLYPLTAEGRLETKLPPGARNGQAYRTSAR